MLVYQYRVSRPGTLSAYAEIFGGVDLVMFEQSFVTHYQYLKGQIPVTHFYASLFFKKRNGNLRFTLSRISPSDSLGNRNTQHNLNYCCV